MVGRGGGGPLLGDPLHVHGRLGVWDGTTSILKILSPRMRASSPPVAGMLVWARGLTLYSASKPLASHGVRNRTCRVLYESRWLVSTGDM